MSTIRVRHRGVTDLAADLRHIATTAHGDMRDVVQEGIRVGNTVAKDYARESSGEHARKYPGTFSAAMNRGYRGQGVSIIQGEYGPRSGGQGDLASVLENGTRNNPPHNNLAKSADLIGPAFQGEVSRLPDRWFWPER